MSRAARALAALLLSFSTAAAEDSDFDFYVLALSWSPTWCANAPSAGESAQCAEHAGFVVHGLWPQRESGYPQFCEAGEALAPSLVDSVLDIMPDAGLVAHQWRKHGTCSGMPPESYFARARAAFAQVEIPPLFESPGDARRISADLVEAGFAGANSGLTKEGIAIVCDGGSLAEVRICLTRDLAFRACAEVDRQGCRRDSLALPAAP